MGDRRKGKSVNSSNKKREKGFNTTGDHFLLSPHYFLFAQIRCFLYVLLDLIQHISLPQTVHLWFNDLFICALFTMVGDIPRLFNIFSIFNMVPCEKWVVNKDILFLKVILIWSRLRDFSWHIAHLYYNKYSILEEILILMTLSITTVGNVRRKNWQKHCGKSIIYKQLLSHWKFGAILEWHLSNTV